MGVRCSFCNADPTEDRRVIHGPDAVGICYECACLAIAIAGRAEGTESLRLSSGRCSFCTQRSARCVGGLSAFICDACLDLARGLIMPTSEEQERQGIAREQWYADQGLVEVIQPPPGGWTSTDE